MEFISENKMRSLMNRELDVDTVSGATNSSIVIKKVVEVALKGAA